MPKCPGHCSWWITEYTTHKHSLSPNGDFYCRERGWKGWPTCRREKKKLSHIDSLPCIKPCWTVYYKWSPKKLSHDPSKSYPHDPSKIPPPPQIHPKAAPWSIQKLPGTYSPFEPSMALLWIVPPKPIYGAVNCPPWSLSCFTIPCHKYRLQSQLWSEI